MERENKRLKKELFKQERVRLNRLVNLSQEVDPRILAWRRVEDERKRRRKEEARLRKEQKRRELEEKKRAAEEREARKREQAERAQREKEVAKRQKREEEEQVRSSFKLLFLEKVRGKKMDKYFADEIIRKLRVDELGIFCAKLEAGKVGNGKQVKAELKRLAELRKQLSKEQSLTEKKKKKLSSAELATKWTEEEMRMLQKGVIKYPAGTHNRWSRIASFVGGRFSETQVVEIARQMKNVSMKGKANSKVQLYAVNQRKTASKQISEPNQT